MKPTMSILGNKSQLTYANYKLPTGSNKKLCIAEQSKDKGPTESSNENRNGAAEIY